VKRHAQQQKIVNVTKTEGEDRLVVSLEKVKPLSALNLGELSYDLKRPKGRDGERHKVSDPQHRGSAPYPDKEYQAKVFRPQ